VHSKEPGITGTVRLPTFAEDPVLALSATSVYDMQLMLGLLREVCNPTGTAAPVVVTVAVYVMVAPGSR
jgi:hypothetical protein